MNIQLRKATLTDMQAVHNLVKQLAEYERAPEAVITTPETYASDIASNYFEAIVAEDLDLKENKIIGMALYYFAYSTWKGRYIWLEDFVVTENYRGKGIGILLFDEMINITKENKTILKWQVLDWNEPAINFYKKYNAEFMDGWITCRFTIDN